MYIYALQCELKNVMSVEWLDELLESISPTLDYHTVKVWLAEHVVPVIDTMEQMTYAELVVKHLERLVRDYELTNKVSIVYPSCVTRARLRQLSSLLHIAGYFVC